MTIRTFDVNKDISSLDAVCVKRNIAKMIPDLISDFGLVVSQDETNIAFGWLYPTLTSKLAIIENIVANKNVEYDVRSEALDMLLKGLYDMAKNMEYKYIKVSTANASMKTRLEKIGYMKLENNVNIYMGVV